MSGIKWSLSQAYIDALNDPSTRADAVNWSGTVNSVQIATVDGQLPSQSNLDLIESYIQVNGTKYYFTDMPYIFSAGFNFSGNALVMYADATTEVKGIIPEQGVINEFTAQGWDRLKIILTAPTDFRMVAATIPNAPAVYFNEGVAYQPVPGSTYSAGGGSGGGSGEGSGGGSGGGGGSSTTPVSGAVIVGGKAVGTVSVDPRTTPVRVTIGGVEQALPAGSVVRNTVTGQKFLKVAGGEMEFAAISITPPAEWSWSAAGVEAWAVLQGF